VRTFVDSNIWVYALDGRNPAKQAAALTAIRADPASLVVSPQVMGELYVTLVRLGAVHMDANDARVAVDALRRFTVVPLEAGHVMTALDLVSTHSISYWDALIVATARGAGCRRLLTEDLQHGAVIAGVQIENPLSMPEEPRRLSEQAARYAAGASWDDAGLRDALARYGATCAAAGMRRTASHSYWDHARRFLDWRAGLYPRGAADRPVPSREVTSSDLRDEVDAYARAVAGAGLGAATVDAYRRHAGFFVRWLDGTFEPGTHKYTT
jgi:predicted nucleic acid-binding protein